ncbi:MAG: aspartyl protease family protein [Planctomycetes bacterium]|nr:aspartyl protease family protein [Planctomycetota bacterium]
MPPTILEPKPGVDMGRVVVTVEIANVEDLDRLSRGELNSAEVRRSTVEALVDTGATFFCLPQSVVDHLGLPFDRIKEARTVTGNVSLNIHRGARIEVQGRACSVEVMALPEARQVLLGQIPLETLDFWVDVASHKLVGNPEHGGQWMAEVF